MADYVVCVCEAPHRPVWLERLAAAPPEGFTHYGLGSRLDLFLPTVAGLELTYSPTGRSLLLGRAWSRGANLALEALDLEQKVATGCPPHEAAWGGFVFLACAPGGQVTSIYRDPSGALEALTWRKEGVRILASAPLEGLRALWPPDMGLDWRRIAAGLFDPVAHLAGSPLTGITSLAPGEAWTPEGPVQVWRPRRWADAPPPDAPAQALVSAVHAALGPFQHSPVVVELSGGLDSAIVAAALKACSGAARQITALNYFVASPQGDERPYARAAAEALSIPLHEMALLEAPLELDQLGAAPPGARPRPASFDRAHAAARELWATRLAADWVLTGQGGDDLFFQTPAPSLVAEGFGRGLSIGDLAAIARWRGVSVYALLAQAWRAPQVEGAHPLLTSKAAALSQEASLHPWLVDLEGTPSVKQMQIHSLAGSLAVAQSAPAGRARVAHPLLSQPLMETCLSIPCWRLTQGGRDRALARSAFIDLAPPSILARRAKGRLSAHYGRRLALSRPQLEDLLADGRLAHQGLIESARVIEALQSSSLVWRGGYGVLLNLIMTELWVRAWEAQLA